MGLLITEVAVNYSDEDMLPTSPTSEKMYFKLPREALPFTKIRVKKVDIELIEIDHIPNWTEPVSGSYVPTYDRLYDTNMMKVAKLRAENDRLQQMKAAYNDQLRARGNYNGY